MESPFLLASALSFRAVSLSVFRLSLVVLGFSFFLLSVMAFFALGFSGVFLLLQIADSATIPLHQE